ncbi:MAG: sigma-70 family RNA polymerase sigma factor [Gemmatimonadetes bacterium]|nr:sigma-70 family RNA polymerase sigma factor [Gemmatimonadota bacterium]
MCERIVGGLTRIRGPHRGSPTGIVGRAWYATTANLRFRVVTDEPNVTQLIHDWREGDAEAVDRLMPLVYDELRRIAQHHLRRERPDHTLSSTALVHEAFMNLVDQSPPAVSDRVHFFAISSRVMRRVLVWHARKRGAAKRGGGQRPVTLDEEAVLADDRLEEVLALDRALERLEALDARLCRVVECRHFGGLTVPETAEALGISRATVKRDWQSARAWLRRELDGSPT